MKGGQFATDNTADLIRHVLEMSQHELMSHAITM